MKNLFSILCMVLFLVSCSEEREVSLLQDMGGLKFEPNHEKPFTGKYIVYWDEGQGTKKEEETYEGGKLEGLTTLWYENGQPMIQGNIKKGKKEGIWTHWDEMGEVAKIELYKNGGLVQTR
ncbi:MAG: hypothetical protein NZ820_16535 [Dehalococcoidia bacterium]|nr:hypothetical protein [Dehalococcoidia bacterium]